MSNTEELNRYLAELSKRNRVKPCRNDKAYDRNKDRKDKKLYECEIDEENECESEQDA
jgi:hypothetical protein